MVRRQLLMSGGQPLRFANLLSPVLHDTYQAIARHVGAALGIPTTLRTAESWDGCDDVGFVCGLAYVRMERGQDCPVEPLAAPVLHGARYAGRPVYFSDVVVRRDRPERSFRELRGCAWAYNEQDSHSGHNVVVYSLSEMREPLPFFGGMIRTGSHERSLRLVRDGAADAAAIDSQILDVLLQRDAELASELRVVDTLGPSSAPPVVVRKTMPDGVKGHLRDVLLGLHQDPSARSGLEAGGISHFVSASRDSYADVERMLELATAFAAAGPIRREAAVADR